MIVQEDVTLISGRNSSDGRVLIRNFSPDARAEFREAVARVVAERACRDLGLDPAGLPLVILKRREYTHARRVAGAR